MDERREKTVAATTLLLLSIEWLLIGWLQGDDNVSWMRYPSLSIAYAAERWWFFDTSGIGCATIVLFVLLACRSSLNWPWFGNGAASCNGRSFPQKHSFSFFHTPFIFAADMHIQSWYALLVVGLLLWTGCCHAAITSSDYDMYQLEAPLPWYKRLMRWMFPFFYQDGRYKQPDAFQSESIYKWSPLTLIIMLQPEWNDNTVNWI